MFPMASPPLAKFKVPGALQNRVSRQLSGRAPPSTSAWGQRASYLYRGSHGRAWERAGEAQGRVDKGPKGEMAARGCRSPPPVPTGLQTPLLRGTGSRRDTRAWTLWTPQGLPLALSLAPISCKE